MITYKKMSLFDAPKETIIVHACNSQGMWGSGIAKPFAQNYPVSYESYKDLHRILTAANKNAIGINSKHIDLLKKEIENRKFEKEVLDG